MKCQALASLGHESVLCNFPLKARVVTPQAQVDLVLLLDSLRLSTVPGLEEMFNESLLDQEIEKLVKRSKGGNTFFLNLDKEWTQKSLTLHEKKKRSIGLDQNLKLLSKRHS